MKKRTIAITGILIAVLFLAGCQESTTGDSQSPQTAAEPQRAPASLCAPPAEEPGWSQILVEVSVPIYRNGVFAGSDILSPTGRGTFTLIWQNPSGVREERGYVDAPPSYQSGQFQLPGGTSFEIFSCGTTFFGRQVPSNVVTS